jgi:RHS repeat-associated protein
MSRRFLLLILALLACNAAAFAQSCPLGASWCSGTFAYDAMGNIRAIGADIYVYDTAGRLVSGTADVQRTGIMSRQDYAYDAFGNRTAASRTTGSVDCLGGCELSPAIDAPTNHLAISTGAQYDDAGNLKLIPGTPNASYTYDAAGSLVQAITGSDNRQFIYTADDERLATANGASWTWTVRGFDGKVLREFTSLQPPTSSWQWSKDYVWRDGLLLASVAPTTPGTTASQHFHLDHLGTPRLVTGNNGVQISVHAYYPFGAELNLTTTEQPAELLKFTGHERDLLANDPHTLDYMHARSEMGTIGRFLSVDPVHGDTRKPQSWNRYSYVRNSPLNYTDPSGLQLSGQITVNGDDSQLDPLNRAVNSFLSFHWAMDAAHDGINWMKEHPVKTAVHVAGVATLFLQPELLPAEEVGVEGTYVVYEALDESGEIIYVGITNNLERRAIEQAAEKDIIINGIEGAVNLTKAQARGVEQVLIEHYGLGGRLGQTGRLMNKINSIARTNPTYASATAYGKIFLQRIGYVWK